MQSAPSPDEAASTTLLWIQFNQADSQAAAALFERLRGILIAAMSYRLSPKHRPRVDLDDLVLEVWSRFLAYIKGTPGGGRNQSPLLIRIALNLVIDVARHLNVHKTPFSLSGPQGTSLPAQNLPDSVTSASARLRRTESAAALQSFLDSLDEDERTILCEGVIEGQDPSKLALQLNLTLDAYHKRRYRLLERLRQSPPPFLRALNDLFASE